MTTSRTRHLLGNDLVREARRRASLTQAELADRAGTTQSAIARLERGGTAPSFEHVVSLVRACDLDLEVAMVDVDDADLWQAYRNLRLSPQERLDRHARVTGQLRELRRTGEMSRHGLA